MPICGEFRRTLYCNPMTDATREYSAISAAKQKAAGRFSGWARAAREHNQKPRDQRHAGTAAGCRHRREKSLAVGRLKKANPTVAPHNARLTMIAAGGNSPKKPIKAIVAAIGTTFATVNHTS